MNARVVTPREDEWPKGLHELGGHAPVARLHVVGRPIPAMEKTIAIVGTRRPTSTGIEAARTFSRALVDAGFVIVSGLAIGIDAAAHAAALESGGHTVAVIGCGLDVDYPRRNARLRRAIEGAGTIVSEYEEGTPPHQGHFPERNRIIAGLSTGVIVVEGGLRSGALITARRALDAGRHVWAVPGSIRNAMAAGPNELIRAGQGALVTAIEHVFEDLAPRLVWDQTAHADASPPELEDDDIAVLASLDDVPTHLDLLRTACGLTHGALALALTRLEVRGFVLRQATGYSITEGGSRARRAAFASVSP